MKEEIAEILQVEVMEDYIRDAEGLSPGEAKNAYMRGHFEKLVEWVIDREDKIREEIANNVKNILETSSKPGVDIRKLLNIKSNE